MTASLPDFPASATARAASADFEWTQREIIHTYNHLADACLVVLLVVYLFFALRLDKLVTRHLPRPGE